MASCLGGQSHGVPQDAVSPLYHPTSSHITSHSTPIHPHLHARFDFQPKQTANCWQPRSPVPMATAHKGTASALMIWICRGRTKRPIQSQPRDLDAGRAFCWTLGLNTQERKEKKIGSVQDLSHPINRVILTHPVTWRRLAEQRGRLSGLDGTSNRGVMGKDTTSASVINSVYC